MIGQMASRYEVQLVGIGGQGLAMSGLILAEAAIHEGKHVIQTEVHGVSSRGGPSRAEVIISDEEIDYPAVSRPDVLLALTQRECNRYVSNLKEGGVLIVDSTNVRNVAEINGLVYALPLTALARDRLGQPMVANMVALGVIASLTWIVSLQALEKAIRSRVPSAAQEINIQALHVGFQVGEDVRGELSNFEA
ncbi:MAG: 2-oxoacid:acceptor oxidoreductase family protein [Chloroflexi bacterium]|nr:2-oxoacid:acceptor oxidoreductase family protein [Chloroflexota bacterium]MCL5074289.1 2-oxoacid:acceptor oxidoreductase family protein [Chloroflexota bacterium]